MQYTAAQSTNALQRVAFIVEFSREFSEAEFRQFDDTSKSWRNEYPKRSVVNAASVRSNQIMLDESKVVALSYEALMKDGSVEWGLKFDGNRILFFAGKYTRWNEIWPSVSRHLKPALELVQNDNPVISYATEYTDLFRAIGDYFCFDASHLFQRGSKYVPSHIFGRTENFHFHTGFFETLNEPAKHRVLTRINADLRDGAEKNVRELSIVLYHQISSCYEPWGGSALRLDKKIVSRGLDNFAALHDIDKATLKEILNHDMSEKIGL